VIPIVIWAFKVAVVNRIDKVDQNIDKINMEIKEKDIANTASHKNMWEEINKTREKLAVVATTQEIRKV
jgi:phosphopentomutase